MVKQEQHKLPLKQEESFKVRLLNCGERLSDNNELLIITLFSIFIYQVW